MEVSFSQVGRCAMDADSAIRAMVDKAGTSMRAVSLATGRGAPWLGSMLHRGTVPTLGVAADVAAACGYAVAFVPMADLPPSALAVDPTPPRQPRE